MEEDEKELISRCQNGDSSAFEQLYHRYVKRIYGLARRMVGAGQEPEELTQEVFLQAYKNLKRFKGESSFYTWLYRVACNTCLQHLRRKSRNRATVNYDDLADVQIPGHEVQDPLEEVSRRELARRVEASLAKLPESQRLVLVLGPIEGHSYEQIAEILDLTVPVVKGRLHRARENIRRLCKETTADESGDEEGRGAISDE